MPGLHVILRAEAYLDDQQEVVAEIAAQISATATCSLQSRRGTSLAICFILSDKELNESESTAG